MVDVLCDLWPNDDSGIWELKGAQRAYTNSKMMCWVALEHAAALAEHDTLPDGRTSRWRATQRRIATFVEQRCWSPQRNAYTFHADSDALDASVLLASRMGYADPAGERMAGTIAAVRDELADGPFVYRFSGSRDEEGAFVACSFWLVEALALAGRIDEAADLMDRAVDAAGDLGLLSEEIDPSTGMLLGNYPQGLSHLSLVNAALTIERGRW